MMQPNLKRNILFIFYLLMVVPVSAQYPWKLSKDKDGIKVYLAAVPGSALKAIKVECTLDGTIDKLISVITTIPLQKEWVYSNKIAYLIKKFNAYDLYYYTETSLPWPLANRDAVVHLKIINDSLANLVTITDISDPHYVPEKKGRVRVLSSSVLWMVTSAGPRKINIVYTFEADPGGNLPAWLVNMFADKGPYQSFKKLAAILEN
jgi:hypothetical protein